MDNGILHNGIVLGSTVDNTQIFAAIDSFLNLLFLLAFIMYVIFSFIASRQIHIMKNTLTTSFSGLVQILGYLHLAIAIFVLIIFAFFS